MFTKPARVKSSSQMKGSDKKKFKAELRKRFGAALTDDAINALVPNKEEVLMTKFQTDRDGAVYAYVHNKTPLFFEMDKEKTIFPGRRLDKS
jgi:translation initiation factor 2D